MKRSGYSEGTTIILTWILKQHGVRISLVPHTGQWRSYVSAVTNLGFRKSREVINISRTTVLQHGNSAICKREYLTTKASEVCKIFTVNIFSVVHLFTLINTCDFLLLVPELFLGSIPSDFSDLLNLFIHAAWLIGSGISPSLNYLYRTR